MSINKICKELKREYNADILNKYPEYKKIFMEMANEYVNFKGANNNLMKLINNLDKPVLKFTSEYMTGPTNITILEHKKYNKRIVLFGEYHPSSPNCSTANKLPYINIIEYLKKVFNTTTKFIDFYLELRRDSIDTHITGKDILLDSGQTLHSMYKSFKNCMTTNYRTCEYPIRMHYVDIRTIDVTNTPFIYAFELLYIVSGIDTLKLYIRHNLPFLFKLSKIKNNKQLKKFMIDTIIKGIYISKEIKRSDIKDKIVKLIHTHELWDKLYDYFNEDVKSFIKYATSEAPINNILCSGHIFSEYQIAITKLSVLIQDIYTITRMFKTFKTNKDTQPPGTNNIIFYGGMDHSDNLIIMLKSLGFSTISHHISDTKSCMHMKHIPYPLF